MWAFDHKSPNPKIRKLIIIHKYSSSDNTLSPVQQYSVIRSMIKENKKKVNNKVVSRGRIQDWNQLRKRESDMKKIACFG